MVERNGEYLRQTPEYLQWYEEHGFARLKGDRVQLLDPITGEDLPAGAFPECVESDPTYKAGIEVLKSLPGRDISVDLVFNYHRGIQDYQALVEKAGPLLKKAAVVGLEWNIGKDADIPTRVADISWDDIVGNDQTMGSYIRASRGYVGADRAVPCDIDHPSGIQGTLRGRLGDVLNHAETIGRDDLSARREEEVGWMVYHAVRNPMMLANFGYGVGLHDNERTIPDGSSVALVVGCYHTTAMSARLENMGISPRIQIVKASEQDSEIFTQSSRDGRFSLKELENTTH